MPPQQRGHSLAVAEELSPLLVQSLPFSGGPIFLYGEKNLLSFCRFVSSPLLSLLFLRVLLSGSHPMQKGFSLGVVTSSSAAPPPPAWKLASPSSCPAAQQGELRGKANGGTLPSLTPHLFSPPEGKERSETCWHHIREKRLVQGSALPLK